MKVCWVWSFQSHNKFVSEGQKMKVFFFLVQVFG